MDKLISEFRQILLSIQKNKNDGTFFPLHHLCCRPLDPTDFPTSPARKVSWVLDKVISTGEADKYKCILEGKEIFWWRWRNIWGCEGRNIKWKARGNIDMRHKKEHQQRFSAKLWRKHILLHLGRVGGNLIFHLILFALALISRN